MDFAEPARSPGATSCLDFMLFGCALANTDDLAPTSFTTHVPDEADSLVAPLHADS
ncbi:MAG: hypothetical protein IT368_15930 [Candidatus Hydrogenedentes bacterium]|nr:hypothetical protein [Candidatus Hydrogenedentota bacterium]